MTNKQIPVEQTFDQDSMYDSLTKDIICGHCGDLYPKVRYAVDGEDLTMTMTCDEQCGSQTIYKFWKKSGNLHFNVTLNEKH